jgi:hypothetical protein
VAEDAGTEFGIGERSEWFEWGTQEIRNGGAEFGEVLIWDSGTTGTELGEDGLRLG